MSQREVEDFSLDAHVADLEAVVAHLDLCGFDLFAPMVSGQIAIAYAARHVEQPLQLVLWNSWRCHTDIHRAPSIQAMETLLDEDWITYTEAYAHLLLGWDQGEPAHRYAAMMRESITPEINRRRADAMRTWDVSDLLPGVRARTLVLQRSGLGWLDLSIGRDIAASIPDARLVVLEGSSVPPFLGESEEIALAIDGFLGEREPQSSVGSGNYATQPGSTRRPALNLSARQREVLSLIARGMTNREIATELVLSLRTVERHVNDIYARLGVRNRTEAVALALQDER
jgi:DNA-binding CsgD family transcriptional regulator/pimeloyl-ACP methyl ester carboxylesterase